MLNSYVTPFEAPGILPDPPVPGAIEWLNEIATHFDVAIHTTRAQSPHDRHQIWNWLTLHGADIGLQHAAVVTNQKLPSLVYIDDRAYRFEGDNFPTRDQIYRLKPWYKV